MFYALTIVVLANLFVACGPDVITTERVVIQNVFVCSDEAGTQVDDRRACPAGQPSAKEDADPCDLALRTYSESGNFVDVPVGAAPALRILYKMERLWSGTSSRPTSVVEVTSRQGCGAVNILGVGVLVRRKDGASIPKHVSGRINELNVPSTNAVYRTGTGWYETTESDTTAPTMGVTWDTSGWAKGVGTTEFAETKLEANDTLSLGVNVADLQDVPIGVYEVSVSLRWRDVETGVEVFYADLDHTTFDIEVTEVP